MSPPLMLVLDTIEDQLVEQSLELLGFARACGAAPLLVVPGRSVSGLAATLAEQYRLPVVSCEHDQLFYPNPELLRRLAGELAAELQPGLVALRHTMRNCQLAAGLAVATGGACITAVESCTADEEGPIFRRSLVGGKLRQSIRPLAPTSLITVLPGAFKPPAPTAAGRGAPDLVCRTSQTAAACYRPIGLDRRRDSGPGLDEAEVVVAAGRGIGKEEHLGLVAELATIFANAAVGASRPLCDLKWLPYSRQIGVSGRSIAPRLYVACGISGAQQHLAGIGDAQCLVAINRDPDAAIFGAADYIVVDDLHEFIPELLQRYRKRFGDE